MNIPVGKYNVRLTKPGAQGNVWIVRLFRRYFFYNKLISSDWFLDERQAYEFAEQLAEQLRQGASVEKIKNRIMG